MTTTDQNYVWIVRQAIARRTPLAVRRWIMGYYYGVFARLDRLSDFAYQSLHWQNQAPRVHFPRRMSRYHSIWETYATYPPLRFAPYDLAELCHWVNSIPEHSPKPCVVECEHLLAMAGRLVDWQYGLEHLEAINQTIAQEQCRFVFTYSSGLREHSRRYLRPELWHKFGYIYPVFPTQAEAAPPDPEPFTILTIASRFSDKGVPEAMQAFRVLRDRHGQRLRLILVSQAVPAGYTLPDGVILYNTPRMGPELRAKLFRSAHVLLIPCYSDSAMPLVEACAFGVPVITVRIHHGDEFVQEGVNGHLLSTPVFSYSADYGTRWKSWEEFLADLDRMRESGALQTVVTQAVDRLESMLLNADRTQAMGRAGRRWHAEHFSPEVRNQRLLRVYQAALRGDQTFPE